jgi:hypothetical protein
MTLMRWIICFGLIPFIAAMPAAADGPSLVGYWYSEDYQPAVHVTLQEVTYRRADGTYQDEFRRYENCVLVHRHTETGTWLFDGGRYQTTTTSINGVPAHVEDDYDVKAMTATQFQYFHPGLGQLFTDTRVRANFRFPDCPTS